VKENCLRHLDLCSGIGGFSLGLEATGGVKTVAFCEREAYPQAILKQHWPDVPCYTDVKELTYAQLEADGLVPVDLLTAGYPCQSFSTANTKREGTKDPRYLWPDIFRLVRECRPPMVLFENVEGQIRRGLDEVWSNLEDQDYAVRTFNIPASAVGAPHRRERIWIIGFNSVADSESQRIQGLRSSRKQELEPLEYPLLPCCHGQGLNEAHWKTEPEICRVVDGFPTRVDQIKALGNAIVPQIAYLLGVALLNTLREIPR